MFRRIILFCLLFLALIYIYQNCGSSTATSSLKQASFNVPLYIDDGVALAGQDVVFDVQLYAALNVEAAITYSTKLLDGDTAAAGVDFVECLKCSVIIPPGEKSATITIEAIGSGIGASDKTFHVVIDAVVPSLPLPDSALGKFVVAPTPTPVSTPTQAPCACYGFDYCGATVSSSSCGSVVCGTDGKKYRCDSTGYVVDSGTCSQECGSSKSFNRAELYLENGKSVWTNNFELRMQYDGNLVIYPRGSATAVWHSATNTKTCTEVNPCFAAFQVEGNFVLYQKVNGELQPYWDTGTYGIYNTGVKLIFQDSTPYLNILDSSNNVVWSRP